MLTVRKGQPSYKTKTSELTQVDSELEQKSANVYCITDAENHIHFRLLGVVWAKAKPKYSVLLGRNLTDEIEILKIGILK